MEEINTQIMNLCSRSEPAILYLPWEVMQEIFDHLDGKTLIICKRVCRSWKKHIDYLEQKKLFWFGHCKNEIPPYLQYDLLDNIFPRNSEKESCVDWQIVYKAWYLWNNLHDSPVTVKKIVSGFNGITSIKISGEWLLISTCEGNGKLTALNLQNHKSIDISVFGGPILNFELVFSDRQCVSNVTPTKELEDIFNTLEHNEIWLELDTCYIHLGKTFCIFLDKCNKKIRYSNGYELRHVNEANSSVLYLKKICSKISGPEEVEIHLQQKYSVIIDFWLNQVCLKGLVDRNCSLDLKTLTVDMKSQIYTIVEHPITLSFPAAETWSISSWHASLFLIYSRFRCFMFSKKSSVMHKIEISAKQGYVTSALFYTKFLFLGLSRGQLLIYELEHIRTCVIRHCQNHSWKNIQVGNSKIVHIAVAEPIHHKTGENPIIVCASPEDVYYVFF